MKQSKTVLIIDDDRDVSELLQMVILERTDYRPLWIGESELTLYAAPHVRPALILLDYRLPRMHGLELYDRLQEIETMRNVPTVLITAWDDLPLEELRRRGIYLLRKPFDLEELLQLMALLLPYAAPPGY